MARLGPVAPWSFRDVATLTGIRPGRLFRSAHLSKIDDDARDHIAGQGVTDVVDLRSSREVEKFGPSRVPEGVTLHRLPFQVEATAAPHETTLEKLVFEDAAGSAADARGYMINEYERFVVSKGTHTAVRQLISLIADQRSVLVHCFAGKDRTGFIIALVLEAVGVSPAAFTADYLKSNDAVPQLREEVMHVVRRRASERSAPEIVERAEQRLTEDTLGVRTEYLTAARAAIDDAYGPLPDYFAAIGVSTETVSRLRDSLHPTS